MSKAKTYPSKVMGAIHETASGLHKTGIMDKQTMREFDELCLTPILPLSADDICEIRNRECMSQAVFARYLNVTTGLVSQWERGVKCPSGASLKLLNIVKNKGIEAIL